MKEQERQDLKQYLRKGKSSARCLHEKALCGAPPKRNGRIEAQLTLLAYSEPPYGRSKWTVRLLADKLIEIKVVDAITHMSMQRLMKKFWENLY